jgi:hypothetical protein
MKNTNNKWILRGSHSGSEELFDIKCFDNREDAIKFMQDMACGCSYYVTNVTDENPEPNEQETELEQIGKKYLGVKTILETSYVVEINLLCDWIFYGKYYDEAQATRAYDYLTKKKNVHARVFKNIKELVE